MRIIKPSPELASFQESSETPAPNQLLKQHPAALLFNTISIRRGIRHSTLICKLSDGPLDGLCDFRSVTGCLVDLAVRSAAEQSLGSYELSEYEMRLCAPFATKSLKILTNVDLPINGCAIFYCAIYRAELRSVELLAESQGTLSLRSQNSQTTNRQHGQG